MARFHVFECNSQQDGNVIVVHKSGEAAKGRSGLTHTSLCDTGKEAIFTYLQLCDRDGPNQISFQPPADSAAIIKDATHVREFDRQGVDLFKSLLSPVFVD